MQRLNLVRNLIQLKKVQMLIQIVAKNAVHTSLTLLYFVS